MQQTTILIYCMLCCPLFCGR